MNSVIAVESMKEHSKVDDDARCAGGELKCCASTGCVLRSCSPRSVTTATPRADGRRDLTPVR